MRVSGKSLKIWLWTAVLLSPSPCAALPGILLIPIMRRADNTRKIQELLKENQLTLKLEALFLLIIKTNAVRARLASPSHRGRMPGKTKKRKVSLGASKPPFSSTKQARKDLVFRLCVQFYWFYWLRYRYISCSTFALPVHSEMCGLLEEHSSPRQTQFPDTVDTTRFLHGAVIF